MSYLLPMVTNLKSHTHQAKLFEIILLSLLGTLMYVTQVVMAALPNIELVSLLIILITRKFGAKAFISIYIFVACEILTYGLSIWVINYLYVWAVLCFVILIVKGVNNSLIYALISAIFGLLFGTLCSIPYFIIGGIEMGIANIISGIGFDIAHCVGNFVLTILLYKPLTNVFEKLIKPHKN